MHSFKSCLYGGNLCDACYDKSMADSRAEFMKYRPLTMPDPPKPKVDLEPLPEINGIDGVISVYELTLTTTKDDPYELRQFFKKICDSKMFDVKAFKACVELQENGKPHIHAMLWSGKKVLNSNHVKSKIKFPYIFTLKFVRRQLNYYNYILKEKDSPNIIEYCRLKGIPQIWSENMRKEDVPCVVPRDEVGIQPDIVDVQVLLQ